MEAGRKEPEGSAVCSGGPPSGSGGKKLALVEGCKHTLEISIPVEEVVQETDRAVEALRAKTTLRGFRPGKAPANLVRARFKEKIRHEVLEAVVPRWLGKRIEEENLKVVGEPTLKNLKFEDGEPITFTAEFEVAPEFELGEYRGITVRYAESTVTDEDVDKRLADIREQKAQMVSVDPRPVEKGDFAVVSLETVSGVEGEPIKSDEMTLEIGGKDTMEAFTENLTGMTPGDEKEFTVSYPDDYGQERLAGKSARFHAVLKGIRLKELPELTDEFAQDLGDYRDLAELREAVRKSILREKEYAAEQQARNELIDKLVEAHDFPVPEVFVDDQIRRNVDQYARTLAAQGMDPRNLKLDWEKVKEAQQDQAVKDVKASLLIGKIAEREAVEVTHDEVDRELQQLAKHRREPVAALRMQMEKDGSLRSLANRIRVEKTLTLLFEQARKVAE